MLTWRIIEEVLLLTSSVIPVDVSQKAMFSSLNASPSIIYTDRNSSLIKTTFLLSHKLSL